MFDFNVDYTVSSYLLYSGKYFKFIQIMVKIIVMFNDIKYKIN